MILDIKMQLIFMEFHLRKWKDKYAIVATKWNLVLGVKVFHVSLQWRNFLDKNSSNHFINDNA